MLNAKLTQNYQGNLHFYWNAYYKDGKVLCQFSEDGQENMFTDIDRNPEKFKKFELINLDNKEEKYNVDLETGDFNFNGVVIKNSLDLSGSQLQCIFWRRKAITLNLTNASESSKYLHYILGWQANINGASIKREYRIIPGGVVQEVVHKVKRALISKARIHKD